MSNQDITILILKDLSGEISPRDKEQLLKWMDLDPKNRNEYAEIKLIWNHSGDIDFDEDEISDATFDAELKKLESAVQDSVDHENLIKRQTRLGRYKTAVIAILFIALAAIGSFYFTKDSGSREFKFTSKELGEVDLSDHSHIILNKNSTLKFSDEATVRKASLQGEAIFNIAKADKPFQVRCSDVTITVLGTSFMVKSYPDYPTEVVVVSGVVEIAYQDGQVKLLKGERAEVQGIGHGINKEKNLNRNFDSWYTKNLEFNDAELRTVFKTVQEVYGVSFIATEEEILKCRFTGTFKDAKLEEIIKTLSYSMNINIIAHADYYEIKGQGCVP
ncbi:MAG TPA: FecR family protein [Chryseolinea sp.]